MKTRIAGLIFGLMFSAALSGQDFTEIKRLRFNTTDFNEFAPFLHNGKLYFCSNRKTSLTSGATDGEKPVYTDNAYEIADTTYWKAVIMPAPLNTPANDGPMCFDAGGTLWISRNFAAPEQKGKKAKVGIFAHTLKDGKWSEKIPFDFNDTGINTGHPSVSPDGQFLFFASDRPGGAGGFDIYWCRKENGKWSQPVNAGANINSPRNEIFPFIHSSGKLYYSSDKDSINGFDIFESLFENGIAGTSVLLKSPINSNANDFSFWCDATTENGFFASNRKGSDDIYRFRSTFPVFDQCDSIKENNYCFTFYEENQYDIDTNLMAYEWDFGETKIRKKEADFCFLGPGSYEVSLNIIDKATGEISQSQASYTMELEEIIQPVITLPENIAPGQEVTFSAEKSHLPGFEVLGYYWRFNDEVKLSGQTVKHSFKNSGKQTVWLGVILKDTENNSTIKKCVFTDFLVK